MSQSHEFLETDLLSSHFSTENDVNIPNLSLNIYTEFEKLIKNFGEDSFITLIALVAKSLDTLNDVYKQKDRIVGELDGLKHDHALLISRHESVKAELKLIEERFYELEDTLQEKEKTIESLQSSAASTKRLLEMKIKYASDQITRLEDRDKELQTTYTNLRQRYSELFRAHVELTERIRVPPAERRDEDNIPTSSTTARFRVLSPDFEPCSSTTVGGIINPLMLVSHKGDSPYEWGVDPRYPNQSDVLPEMTLDADGCPFSRLSVDDNYEDVSAVEDKSDSVEMADTSRSEGQARDSNNTDFDAIKEVAKLVNECNEKEDTINALKVVLNDLMTDIEESNWDKERLKETLSQIQVSRSTMHLLIKQLEEDNARLKRELREAQAAKTNAEEVPFYKRGFFTRDEMAKVLMERAQLQEDVTNLRETLHSVKAERSLLDSAHPTRASGSVSFRNLFSRLFRRSSRVGSLPSVSFDTSTSGVSMEFPNSPSPRHRSSVSDAKVMGRKNESTAKVSRCSSDWWITVPLTGRPCGPEPVVLVPTRRSDSAAPSSSSFSSDSNTTPVNHQLPPPPPLPKHLYRRPIPEALSQQMQITCGTSLFGDIGGLLPSGELVSGRSTFFPPLATPLNPSGEAPSNLLWLCLAGLVDSAFSRVNLDATSATAPPQMSLCSQIVVVDADQPSRYVESFSLPRSVVTCIAAVPGGATSRDYEVLRLSNTTWESIAFTRPPPPPPQETAAANEAAAPPPLPTSAADLDDLEETEGDEGEDSPASIQTNNTLSSLRHFVASAGREIEEELLCRVVRHQQRIVEEQEARALAGPSMVTESANVKALSKRTSAFEADLGEMLEGSPSDFYRVERQKFARVTKQNKNEMLDDTAMNSAVASAQQTVWLGCQNGDIFVHSCDSSQRRPLQSTRLPGSITAICHLSGRVFVGLADGHIVVFRRQTQTNRPATDSDPTPPIPRASTPTPYGTDAATTPLKEKSIREELAEAVFGGGAWDLSEAVVIRCVPASTSGLMGVRTLIVVPPALTVWAAIRNRVVVVDATTFQRLFIIDVVQNTSCVVRELLWSQDGVWTALRKDPVLRLFNAFTYEPMQQVDVVNIIYATVGSPDSVPLSVTASVTAMGASKTHLWVGTHGGHVICIPFKPTSSSSPSNESLGGFGGSSTSAEVDASSASVSGYGHTEAVNFFSLVGTSSSSTTTTIATGAGTRRKPSGSETSSLASSDASASRRLLMFSGGTGVQEHYKQNASSPSSSNNSETSEGKRNLNSQSHLLVWSLSDR